MKGVVRSTLYHIFVLPSSDLGEHGVLDLFCSSLVFIFEASVNFFGVYIEYPL